MSPQYRVLEVEPGRFVAQRKFLYWWIDIFEDMGAFRCFGSSLEEAQAEISKSLVKSEFKPVPHAVTGPHNVTLDFEHALCDYTGAPFAVATTSCTMALLLAVAWHFRGHPYPWDMRPRIEIPKRTYVSVPQSIIHAGGRPVFRDEDWVGAYQLKPLPVWDCARRFTSGMFPANVTHDGSAFIPHFQCVSFHAAKILGDTQGGAILHNDPAADAWFRRARFDGRTPGVAPMDDAFDMIGWHAYLSPDVAARLLFHLSVLPKHNADLPNDPYPDLSQFEIFK